MPSSASDKQPLLPQYNTPKSQSHSGSESKSKPHVNHSSSSRLSTTRISFPSSTSSALSPSDENDPFPLPRNNDDDGDGDEEQRQREGERYRGYERSPLTSTRTFTKTERKPGLPKLSRECLWSEIKCYGSYMLPPLLIFGVLVVGASLFAVGWKMGWFK
ncbi:hypothetical protein IAT40_000576 [Kwoniella sp. CBS 6097]